VLFGGKYGGEATLLRLAGQIEQARRGRIDVPLSGDREGYSGPWGDTPQECIVNVQKNDL